MEKEDREDIKMLVKILKDESQPIDGHTDVPAYRFCWSELVGLVDKL